MKKLFGYLCMKLSYRIKTFIGIMHTNKIIFDVFYDKIKLEDIVYVILCVYKMNEEWYNYK